MSINNTVGIIAEYNPLHSGHEYHIGQSKKITDSDCCIAVISGDFVQRGEPAIFDKYTRCQMAINAGVDLVIELPAIFACSSANYFAKGAIDILNKLGVDYLSFGSESGELTKISRLVNFNYLNKEIIDNLINEKIKTGLSYPKARYDSIKNILENACENKDLLEILETPNNILAYEYLWELKISNSDITPVTVKRIGNGYNDDSINHTLSSATAIRATIKSENDLPSDNFCTANIEIINRHIAENDCIYLDDFTDIIKYKLLELKNTGYNGEILDLPVFLFNKLINSLSECATITELINSVKTKDLTYSRISRSLIHLLLDISTDKMKESLNSTATYIRVLGFSKKGQEFLSSVKDTIDVPIIVKPANYKEILENDINASNIYNIVRSRKTGKVILSDYREHIIM